MEIGDLFSAGSDILDAVTDAVERNDYSNLSDTIRSRVDEVSQQSGVRSHAGTRAFGRTSSAGKSTTHFSSDRPAYQTTSGERKEGSKTPVHYSSSYGPGGTKVSPQWTEGTEETAGLPSTYFNRQKISRTTGLISEIAGFTGAAVSGISSISSMLGLAAAGLFGSGTGFMASSASLVVSLLLTAGFTALGINGLKTRELTKKYYNYGRALGNAEYFTIEDFARRVGTTATQLIQDLKKMKKKGYLPGAVMDSKETTMMLTDRAYEQYDAAEKARIARELEASEAETAAKADNGKPQTDPETQAVLKEGEAYIREIRRINDSISDNEAMSDKLYRLESIMRQIFDQLQKNPSCVQDLRKLMQYYLPTTKKLLEAYVELNNQPQVGENIPKTRQEIEESMDTINDAFEKLLDDMFQDVAWDISSDLSVMKTMLEQDGLAERKKQ